MLKNLKDICQIKTLLNRFRKNLKKIFKNISNN